MTRSKSWVIGLTGGIATGKSTAAGIIRSRGYVVIDADEIARKILEPGQPGYLHVIEEFSNSILTEEGIVDRKKLGDLIFTNKAMREKLDSLLHPIITDEIQKNLEIHGDENIIFIDIPLLFEVKKRMEHEGVQFDKIWLVYADRDTQLSRLTKRNNLSIEEAEARVNSQIDIEYKKNMADVVISNTSSLIALETAVDFLLKDLMVKSSYNTMHFVVTNEINGRNGREE